MPQILRITITIDTPDGSGSPPACVEQHSPEQGRPSEGPPGAAGPPASASGDVPVEVDTSDNPAAEKALQLLREFKVDHPEKIMAEYAPARVIAVCQAAYRARDRIHNLPAWIQSAIRGHYTV